MSEPETSNRDLKSDNRFLPVDLLRGFVVWLMLINGNRIDKSLWWVGFSHGSWFQTTVTDLVYPIFLFLAGISLAYSISSAKSLSKKEYFFRLLKRALRLIALGIILRALPEFEKFNLFGTLQCIGYALIVAAVIVCGFGEKFAFLIGILIQLLGFLLSAFIADWSLRWSSDNTFFEKVDLYLLGYTGGVEGVLTTVIGSSFILLGFSLKDFLKEFSIVSKVSLGLILLFIALALNFIPNPGSLFWIPIVPRLFNLSFSLFTIGISLLALVLLELFLMFPGKKLLINFLIPFGRNSILAYAGVIAIRKVFFETCIIKCSIEFPSFNKWFVNLMGLQLGRTAAVYLYTGLFLFLAWYVCWVLMKKGIVVKI